MFEELRKPGGKLKMAVPRGALLEEVLDLLDRVGIETTEARGDSRSLVFDGGELILITMRPSDVPTYVSAGAADVGITGKDVLLEQSDRPVYELVDLGIGPCRMVLATQKGDVAPSEHQRRLGMMKIATKYKRIAEQYFAEQGRQVELVEVKGSIELAPLVGLADGIVDLVATGRTLAENNLEVKEEILGSTGRLVANRVSYRIRREEVDDLAARLRAAVSDAPGES
ncbi:MAG: ATP phosphoribosyltransferase [Solirubrobacterales bacterium]|nr:ATP phosphoribosyltransferase [Solirubrobacterales bacterium]